MISLLRCSEYGNLIPSFYHINPAVRVGHKIRGYKCTYSLHRNTPQRLMTERLFLALALLENRTNFKHWVSLGHREHHRRGRRDSDGFLSLSLLLPGYDESSFVPLYTPYYGLPQHRPRSTRTNGSWIRTFKAVSRNKPVLFVG